MFPTSPTSQNCSVVPLRISDLLCALRVFPPSHVALTAPRSTAPCHMTHLPRYAYSTPLLYLHITFSQLILNVQNAVSKLCGNCTCPRLLHDPVACLRSRSTAWSLGEISQRVYPSNVLYNTHSYPLVMTSADQPVAPRASRCSASVAREPNQNSIPAP